jgi:hypothetical protein
MKVQYTRKESKNETIPEEFKSNIAETIEEHYFFSDCAIRIALDKKGYVSFMAPEDELRSFVKEKCTVEQKGNFGELLERKYYANGELFLTLKSFFEWSSPFELKYKTEATYHIQ